VRAHGPAPTRSGTTGIVLACAAVAAGLAGLQLSRPGNLFGQTEDISTYLGAAVRLVHGVLPYRDYVYVQPPGFVLLASPFGLLAKAVGTRNALATLRSCTPLIAAASVILVGRLVRHRGRLVTLVACGVMALYPAELFALENGMLEPVLNLVCLLGASLLFEGDRLAGSRRLLLSGIAFGFAGTVKAPAILPVIVAAALCAPDLKHRLLPFASGVVAGFALPVLAFFIEAPSALFHDVILTQLARGPGAGESAGVGLRLWSLAFFSGRNVVILLTAGVVAGVVVAALLVPPKRLAPLERFAFGAAVLVAAAQFVTAQYYPHYAAFEAPFGAVLLGISLGRLRSWRAPRLFTTVAVAGLTVLLVAQVLRVEAETGSDLSSSVVSVVPAGACALASNPNLLVNSNRFVASEPGCTEMTDPFGTMLAFESDPGAGVGVFRTALSQSDYVVVDGGISGWLKGSYAALIPYVEDHFRLVRAGPLDVFVRDGHPVG